MRCAGEAKVWFQSLHALSQVLSDKNRALLALIAQTQPDSINDLAEKTGSHRPASGKAAAMTYLPEATGP